MVESARTQFRARCADAGMPWLRARLERLLTIRAAIMRQCFDELCAVSNAGSRSAVAAACS
jgi:hypothetical protein